MDAPVVGIIVENINSNQGALAADNNLHIASATIAAYEYVADYNSLILAVTDIWQVILSLFLLNFGYTSLQTHAGKNVGARMRRSRVDWNKSAG